MKILEDRQTRTFFTGTEVEKNPAFGAKTLFIVGTPSIEEIDAEIARLAGNGFHVEQLYFGTSQTFMNMTSERYAPFERLLKHYLEHTSYWVTLDFDIGDSGWIIVSSYIGHERFIPMISVKLPHIDRFNKNATLKLDDLRWGYSNPGVWTHNLHELKQTGHYTDWSDYSGDE